MASQRQPLENELHEHRLRIEEMEQAGEPERAEAAREQAHALRTELRDLERTQRDRAEALKHQRMEMVRQELAQQLDAARSAGPSAEVEKLQSHLARMEAEREMRDTQHRFEGEAHALERELTEYEAAYQAHQAAGRYEEAKELRQRAEKEMHARREQLEARHRTETRALKLQAMRLEVTAHIAALNGRTFPSLA